MQSSHIYYWTEVSLKEHIIRKMYVSTQSKVKPLIMQSSFCKSNYTLYNSLQKISSVLDLDEPYFKYICYDFLLI